MLFADRPASKVIAFDNPPGGTRMGARVEPPAAAAVAPKVATPRKAGTQAKPATDVQPKLDLLPAAPVTPRTLKTKVVASIYCDATVATLTHRSLAGAVDFSLILIEYLMCLGAYHLMGGELPVNRLGYVTFAAAFVVMAMFYGLVWAMGNIETPGMRWASLRLTNFDGQETEPSQRLLRYFGTCLGLATCGFGLLWALVDEESLTWQDHMSKTFPTYHRIETNFCKAR